MTGLPSVDSALRRTALRRRCLRVWEGAWMGVAVGGAFGGAALFLAKFELLSPMIRASLWGLAVLSPLLGMVVMGWRGSTVAATARWLDHRQGLQERLSTAVEIAAQSAGAKCMTAAWSELVRRDAEAAASKVDPRILLPIRIPGTAKWGVVAWLILGGLSFLPAYQSAAQRRALQDAKFIKEAGAQLTGLVKKQLEQRPPVLDPPRRALAEVGELGARLSGARLTREEALKDLAKVTDQVNREASDLQRNPILKKMEQAARNPDGGSKSGGSTPAKKAEDAGREASDKTLKPEVAEKLKKDLEQVQEQAKGLSGDSSPAATTAREKLAQQASQLARQAESMGVPLPNLDAAAAALGAAQVDQFLKDLKTAENDLNQLAQESKALAAMQKDAETFGKDLAEQLKNGQVEAAIQSLAALRQQLGQGKLPPEKMAQLAQAIPAAKPYGNVRDDLQKALAQIQEGKSSDGSQSLASAEQGLKKLLDQLQDAQALEASLANLKQAQMCIGNSMLWGNCSNPSALPKAGQKGKGGKGVGTWAASSAWSMPDQIDDLWDNSGVKRPDVAAKGESDRDTRLSDSLVPTKLKGQFQAGGAMPSISLKGLSVKGSSTVSFTEAVAAAQIDAQAALSQDQVPKAYQNSVRDYFDDLKK